MNAILSRVVLITLFAVSFVSELAWGVDCSSSGITLTTQQQVDDFQATYGGGGICDRVSGELAIRGSDISDIDGLADLTSVVGGLSIRDNAALTDLDGLANLTSVGRILLIYSNAALTDLDGLANLTSVVGSLTVQSNAALTNLDGLANLTGVGGSLSIRNNDLLTNLNGLVNITGVGGGLVISGNDLLTNLDGLANITSVVGNLYIYHNTALTNVDGLANLTSVGGDLYISNNAMTNLDGLANLTSVVGGLSIRDNDLLTNLNGLANITSVVGSLTVQSNAVLRGCSALASLLGWPDGPPNDNIGGDITVATSNNYGCDSVQEILDSVSGPTAPSILSSNGASGQVDLTFSPASTTDALWPVTGYEAQCLSGEITSENNTVVDIPDEDSVVSPLMVADVFSSNSIELNIAVNITHPRTRHLTLILKSPSGTSVMLWDEAAGDGTDLIGTFPTTLEPAEGLSAFDGENFNGEWQLTVADGVPSQTGTLNSWGITIQDMVTATSATSPITLTGLADFQPYSCTVSAITGLGIGPVSNAVSTNTTDNELSNITTRADVGIGNDIAIAGFIITGSGQKCVIVRGRGPRVGVPAGVIRLPNPTLTLKSGSTTIAENDNWTQQDNPDHVAIIEGLGKAPGDLLDAAIYTCLDSGPYTALLKGYLGTTGVGMVEVLDVDDSLPYLSNISTRARVGTDHLVTIAGFIITGNTPKQILIRGRGPSVGVPAGVTRLPDPTLTLKSGQTTIGSNDDWEDAANAADISATGKAPGDPLDSAIMMVLQPGAYTAILRGAGGVTGVGIVEVLDLMGRQ